mgnify:CR=1 FL=1
MKHILITGVGGNVGQYLAEKLSVDGYSVIGVYRRSIPRNYSYKLVQADLAERELDLTDIDTVIHVAAGLSGSTKRLIRDNVDSTMNLVKFAEKTKVNRFIYLSTVSVYGFINGELDIDSDIINPEIYGITKYIAENLVKEADIPMRMVISLPRMLGPFVDLNTTYSSGFLTMAKKILKGESVTCFIPNVLYNNYMHVSDLTSFLTVILNNEQKCGYIKVILGVKEKLEMLEILHIMKDAIQSKSEIIVGNFEEPAKCALVSIDDAVRMGYNPMSAEKVLYNFMQEIERMNDRLLVHV